MAVAVVVAVVVSRTRAEGAIASEFVLLALDEFVEPGLAVVRPAGGAAAAVFAVFTLEAGWAMLVEVPVDDGQKGREVATLGVLGDRRCRIPALRDVQVLLCRLDDMIFGFDVGLQVRRQAGEQRLAQFLNFREVRE